MADKPLIGVGIIIRRDDEVLLVRRAGDLHGQGTWSTPGGHLDPWESFEDCAARETREEVGMQVDNVRFRAVTNDFFPEDDKHTLTVWMEASDASGEPRVEAEYEMDQVGWFRLDALPEPIFPAFDNLLKGRCYPGEGALSPK